ncbi:MAG: hypothetical protein H6720_30890 [Sandaracinus sp.]|nr:hypothetical protein [Sandaracinus sp.]
MKKSLWVLGVLALVGSPREAHAFSTRVHMVIANEVREALIASGDGTIALLWSDAVVRIPPEDAAAIVGQPLAFRAGALGPDSFVFPGMTDATHALGQNPFVMCELLYQDAVTDEERAYALGCFLHGTTDAIAHHFVNHFTGETFTLTPISAGRTTDFSNVVGHIVTESMIQRGFFRADSSDFAAGPLAHDLPQGFIRRNYHDPRSRLWQHMMADANDRLDATRARMPGATLIEVVNATELAPWEQVGLAPLFLAYLQDSRADLRGFLEAEIADLQSPVSDRGSELLVGPGSDGMLSTEDDTTACSASCPELFARYHVFVRLLLPRRSAGGTELPSAFDALSDDLGRQIDLFVPALLSTIENLVAILNTPLATEDDLGFDLSVGTLEEAIAPMRDWVETVLALDYDLLADAITPSWYTQLSTFFSSVGVDIRVGRLLEILFQPYVDQIRTLIEDRVIGEAAAFLGELAERLEDDSDGWRTRIEAQLQASKPTTTTGHALDDIHRSGLFAYSFNLFSATLANRDLVLSVDEVSSGPASFDASYTHHWTQAGLCDYLRPSIFPEGTSVGAVLSIHDGTMFHPAGSDEDSPVECHDGALNAFGTPSTTSCMVTTLDALFEDRVGSVSRSYPPLWAAVVPHCLDVVVPGLPEPPERPTEDGGTSSGEDAGPTADAGEGGGGGGGCSCDTAPTGASSPWGWLSFVGLALFLRRARFARVGVFSSALLLVACGGDDDGGFDAGLDDGGFDAPTPSDGGLDDAGDEDGGVTVDAGPDLRRQLLDALGDSVWSAVQEREERAGFVERAYEHRFSARTLEWGELRNPFGPARMRTLRSFSVGSDGRTLESIILSPDGWPPHPQNGLRQSWDVQIVDGDPRVLRLTDSSGVTEEYEEGAWPEPTEGLTAELRVFGPSGAAWEAFCGAGFTLSDSERQSFWGFARGTSGAAVIDSDVVAGVPLLEWDDSSSGANDFSAIDVHGFDRLGGTLVDDQFNFAVRYTGSIRHPGGSLAMRENDDSLEDAVWVFLDGDVGSSRVEDLFLEVHNWSNADATSDTVTRTLPEGEVPIEILLVRCAMPFDGKELRVEMNLGGTGFRLVGEQPSLPVVDATLFPPVL